MTKKEVEIQAMLLRHQANGCISAITRWEYSTNTEARNIAIPALKAEFQVLEARAQGLDDLVTQWDEFGLYFEADMQAVRDEEL